MRLDTFFSIKEQLSSFLLAIPLGAILGIVYDVFAILRMILPFLSKGFILILQDIIFMLIYGFAIFLFSEQILRGDLRFYVLFSSLIGFFLYQFTLGSFIRIVLRGTFSLFSKIFVKR